MKDYFKRAIKSTVVIWAIFAIGILVASALYAVLKAVGVSEPTSLIITFLISLGLVTPSLLIFPVPLLRLGEEKMPPKPGETGGSASSSTLPGMWLPPPTPDQRKRHMGMSSRQGGKGASLMTWLGFRGYDKVTEEYTSDKQPTKTTREYQPGKTLWDWLTLLIIPIILAVGAIGFSVLQSQDNLNLTQNQFHVTATQYVNDKSIAATRYADDQQLALESTFQTYLDHMSALLTMQNVHNNNLQGADIRSLATARTLTILPDLAVSRRANVLKFLHDAGLITRQDKKHLEIVNPVVNLNGADFSGVNLSGFFLGGADLAGTNLNNTDLSGADLSGAYLPGADLSGANLSRANLRFAQLFNQQPNHPPEIANLTRANLNGADLTGADFIQVNLTNADLTGATVTNTDFTNVTWKNTTCPDGTNSDTNGSNSCVGH